MALSVCQQCGKSFYVRPSRQSEGKGNFCSRQCYFESKRRYAFAKSCEHCGKIFYTKNDDARYCSRSCAGKGTVHVCEASGSRCETSLHTREASGCTGEVTAEPREVTVHTREASGQVNLPSESFFWPQGAHQMFEDPWATGAIPPDRYGRDFFRIPDMWLGF